jgi:hypothetical protein
MRVLVAVAALCAVAAMLPASAAAATWTGKTKQGRKVVVRTGGDGHVVRVRIGWKANCGSGTYTSRTIFEPPFDTSTLTEIADVGHYTAHPDGYVSKIRVTLKGWWVAATDRWRGTLWVRVRVRQSGKLIDTCRLRKLKWSAGRG